MSNNFKKEWETVYHTLLNTDDPFGQVIVRITPNRTWSAFFHPRPIDSLGIQTGEWFFDCTLDVVEKFSNLEDYQKIYGKISEELGGILEPRLGKETITIEISALKGRRGGSQSIFKEKVIIAEDEHLDPNIPPDIRKPYFFKFNEFQHKLASAFKAIYQLL